MKKIKEWWNKLPITLCSSLIGLIIGLTYFMGLYPMQFQNNIFEPFYDTIIPLWLGLMYLFALPYCAFKDCGEKIGWRIMYMGFIIIPLFTTTMGFLIGKLIEKRKKKKNLKNKKNLKGK